ncbi:Phosphate-selective porin O and P [Neptunomonas qingdaonensis]|uniref:Phosphate-selective porin O and P n=2 Tax=Neptunomonas qingdaonensis TaxID=1045558 RepID=A0A1I2V808_9GAMM|nr:Phosphate-selective porin O and P [Neptunomonas qingdaonensis]
MAFFALTITGVAVADSGIASGWRENTRWAVDLSTRFSRDLRQNHQSSQQVVGFDLHKVFTGEQGDFATLVFQPYWVRLHDVKNPGFYFDGGDDAELTWRIANINYTGLSHGSFNLRVGHFEVPFGLEQNIDTNGTLRQYSFRDRGIKADWGVSVNGVLSEFDYEIALTRGSGNNISERDDPYVFAGRLGTPSTGNMIVGFSWFDGKVLAANGAVERQRLAIDMAYYYRQWETLLEVSAGNNAGANRSNVLAELSWRNPMETFHSYSQFRYVREEGNNHWLDKSSVTLGLEWKVNRFVDVSTQWFKELDVLQEQKTASIVAVQLRVRI